MMKRHWAATAAVALLALTACQDESTRSSTRHLSPIPPQTLSLMATKGMSRADPILIRAYKKESELEVWKRSGTDGKYALLKTYPICRWSGQLGPKTREGDRQAPEGFYAVNPAQMNPNSSYYLSFDTGYPNAFDRAHGRSGAHLMVHGSCSSRGCFAMTDEAIAEVYAVARESFGGGQRSFQFQSYPFRMTAENLAKHRHDPHIAFWKNLKEGSDHFEVTRQEPKVSVVDRRYAFATDDPEAAAEVAEKQREDERKVADLVAKGTPAIRVVYDDGGQHPSFRETMMAAAGGENGGNFAVLDARPTPRNLGDVSRPEALAAGPREVPLDGTGKPKPETTTALAFAAPAAKIEAKADTKATASAPAAGKPTGITVVAARTASADPSAAPVQAAAGAPGGEVRPIYQRVLGLFGSSRASAEGAEKETAAAGLTPAIVPVGSPKAVAPASPPSRPKAAVSAAPAAQPSAKPDAAPKPQAAKPTSPERRAALGPAAVIAGAQPALPVSGFARLN